MNKLLKDLKSSALKLTDYLISQGNCHKCSQKPQQGCSDDKLSASHGFVGSVGLGTRALCQLLPGAGQGLARALTQLT